MIRKASAEWHGTGRDGAGSLTTESAVLNDSPYSYRTRFQGEAGTNPEELIAAAHAGCFTMALAFRLQSAGLVPTSLATEATVSLEQGPDGFRITKSALVLTASVPGLEQTTLDTLARDAEQNCPVSRLLKAEITLTATLV